MIVDRFTIVGCPNSYRRWALEGVQCNTVRNVNGDWHWAAWFESDDGRMGDIESGKADSAETAERLAKLAAVKLLSESEENSRLRAMVPKAATKKHHLRKSRGST